MNKKEFRRKQIENDKVSELVSKLPKQIDLEEFFRDKVEYHYKWCAFLENFCKEGLGLQGGCKKECRNELIKLIKNNSKKTEKKEYQLKFRDIIIDIIDIMGYNKEDGEIKEIRKYLESIDNEYVLIKKVTNIQKLKNKIKKGEGKK